MSGMHLFRPEWLWALAVLPLLGVAWWRRRSRRQGWRGSVDPHLLAHLLERSGGRGGRTLGWVAALAVAIATLALAGPSWRQVAQPLWQGSAPLVVAMELSPAMLAGDLPPSRLARAREKLSTLLAGREGGQVGLVVYAGDAFTVAPLTDDPGNVAVFLDSLHPDVMPVPGQVASRGIEHAQRLLRQAGFDQGRILLLASAADEGAAAAAAVARSAGYEVSVLGVGTAEGAPYRASGGQLHASRLDVAGLQAVAGAGGGRYQAMTDDGADLDALDVLDARVQVDGPAADGRALAWVDEGFWLLPPLMLLVLVGFRRGTGLKLLVLGSGLGLVLVAPPAQAVDWWQRPDQARYERLQEGVEAYRKGAFAEAAEAWDNLDAADAHYNRGNALARQGQYREALAAYDAALALQPGMEDALANREVVQSALERQQEGGGEHEDPGDQPGDQSGGQPQPGEEGQEGEPQDGEGEPSGKPDNADDSAGDDRDSGAEQRPPADAGEQAAADQAQRERMEQALADGGSEEAGTDEVEDAPGAPETPEERERRIANEAWLRRVPDDPGGLLREKFRIEYERRRLHGAVEE